jgi:S-adenosylmethionine decarboxylase proenzyme
VKKLEALGRHSIIEYYGCPSDVMNNLELIEQAFLTAARKMGATIVASEFHQFNPYGISGMVIISESHLSIHTWPEYGYAAVDIFTCGEVIDPEVAHGILREAFQSTQESVIEMRRGVLNVPAGTLPKAYAIKSVPADTEASGLPN